MQMFHCILLLLLLVSSSTFSLQVVSAVKLRKSLIHRGGSYPCSNLIDESNPIYLSPQGRYRGATVFQAQASPFSDQDPSQDDPITGEAHTSQSTPHADHKSAAYSNQNHHKKKLPFFSFRRMLNSTEAFFQHFVLMTTQDPDLVKLFSNFLSYAFWVYLGLSILGTIGIDTKPFLSLVSVAGITLGFAAKDILTNSFSGIFILFTRPFQRGSIISVSGFRGRVIAMDIRYVKLQSLTDNSEFLVPLSIVYQSAITIERP